MGGEKKRNAHKTVAPVREEKEKKIENRNILHLST
jgi:hypothetical protein